MTTARTVAWLGSVMGMLFVPAAVERWTESEPHPRDEPERTEQRYVYVLGAVNQPGRQDVLECRGRSGFSLTKVIVIAADLRQDADRATIKVFRNDRFLLEADFDKILEGEHPDVPIEAGDAVYVQRLPR